jgi:hypothetical protein
VEYAVLLARLTLSAVFFVAGLAKLADRAGSRAAMAGFGAPPSLAAPLGIVLPVVELVVAVMLLPASTSRWGALAALLLLILFAIGIVNVMLRGREAECHCFGQLHSTRVGWPTLSRSLALALTAALVAAPIASTPSFPAFFAAQSNATLLAIAAGAVVAIVFAAMMWFMRQLLRQHGRLLLRLDTLEETLAAQGLVPHPAREGTSDGLPVGTPAPSFALPDLQGEITTLQGMLAPALPLMLVFAHPGCTPCAALLPEISGWQSTHRDALTIAVLSQGAEVQNRLVAAEHGIQRVVLQVEREVADAYEAYGTPSAVLVSTAGLIASPVAQGAPAMRALLESVAPNATSNANGASHGSESNGHGALPWHGDSLSAMPRIGTDAR